MKDVLVVFDQDAADVLVATSLLKRLIWDGCRIHILADQNAASVLRFCDECFVEDIAKGTRVKYDTAINFSTSERATKVVDSVGAKDKFGYNRKDGELGFFNEGADHHYRARHIGVPTDANLFQLTFGLAGETWQGEGYWLPYFPRNRTRKSLAGVAIRDERVRRYIYANLELDRTRLWQIPFKQNILKQIDETNRCKNVITDDFAVFNIALALHKNVEYLIQRRPAFKLELFGSGNIHLFSNKLLEKKANV
jgi:hypothetical protein